MKKQIEVTREDKTFMVSVKDGKVITVWLKFTKNGSLAYRSRWTAGEKITKAMQSVMDEGIAKAE